jgi:rod shape-determining protein MreD
VSWLNRQRIGAVAAFAFVTALSLAARVWFGDFQVFGRVRVDLAVIALALASTARGARFGTIAGFLLGLTMDAASPEWLGASAVGFALVGFFSGSFGQTIYVDKTRARAALVILSVLLFDLAFGLLSTGMSGPFVAGVLASVGSACLSGFVTVLFSRAAQLVMTPAKSSGGAALDA